ncbi:MAG: UDP-2,3-diacylglucosamine diphosphatase [Candidatus Kapabacteria bacterium]|nr:UDP-2,3-diacylglucosamine diphosphatase [Candidatus Kapabacteria bacterium]
MVYFLSDVHLGYGTQEHARQREALLIELLSVIAPTAEVLFIVGDLFDYWFEYRTVVPRAFFRTLAALDQLRRAGTQIEYIIGNHDFGHHDFFEKELGIVLHWQDIERTIHGKRFYIAHGDGKVAGDWGYALVRPVLRSRLANVLYRWIHPDIGISLARLSSHKSRQRTMQWDDGTSDSLETFAEQKICRDGMDYVVMGHRHRPAMKTFSCGDHVGTYINLGDWMSQPLVGMFDGERFLLEPVERVIASAVL